MVPAAFEDGCETVFSLSAWDPADTPYISLPHLRATSELRQLNLLLVDHGVYLGGSAGGMRKKFT